VLFLVDSCIPARQWTDICNTRCSILSRFSHFQRPPRSVGVVLGINLNDYYKSTEWDLLAVKAKKNHKYYPCCSEPYPDIKFNITIRRKTLFYTVNLILPCVAICSVTLLVFYIPANSGEKITMGITILNSLNIFLLLVAEINPPTSLATPLIGKYLLFTMVLVTCSIIVTVFVLNIHFRSPSTHVMSPWVQELFLKVLPRLLFMQRPQDRFQLPAKYPKVGSAFTFCSCHSAASGECSACTAVCLFLCLFAC